MWYLNTNTILHVLFPFHFPGSWSQQIVPTPFSFKNIN